MSQDSPLRQSGHSVRRALTASLSSSPSGVRTNTQRSVTYSTCCPREVATAPLKVMCSTSFTNFLAVPSLTMISLSFQCFPADASLSARKQGHEGLSQPLSAGGSQPDERFG